jgi:hypothetical protein
MSNSDPPAGDFISAKRSGPEEAPPERTPGAMRRPEVPGTRETVAGASRPDPNSSARPNRPPGPPSLRAPTRRKVQETLISVLFFMATAISVLTTIGIVGVLLVEASSFFAEVSVIDFLTGRRWAPLFVPQSFGVLPLLAGSFMVAVGAALVAIPIGLASAIYLSEYAP